MRPRRVRNPIKAASKHGLRRKPAKTRHFAIETWGYIAHTYLQLIVFYKASVQSIIVSVNNLAFRFGCILLFLQTFVFGPVYAAPRPNVPASAALRRLIAHTCRTREWPSSPSQPPVPDLRPDQTKGPLCCARRPEAATKPLVGRARRRLGWIGGWRQQPRPSPASRALAPSAVVV